MTDNLSIATDSEVVEQYTENLTTVIDNFSIKEVDIIACDYIKAETNCDFTYSRGLEVTLQYTSALEELVENMKKIHSTIDHVDKNIASTLQ